MSDPVRGRWNKNQQALRFALSNLTDEQETIQLFLEQHAWVHANQVSGINVLTFEDELWEGLPTIAAGFIPINEIHSIAWCIWHTTRCEDITMNMLVAESIQELDKEGWTERLGIPQRDTGNAMGINEMVEFCRRINISELRKYRLNVGWRTREIVTSLHKTDFKRRVNPQAINKIMEVNAVLPSENWLVDYWGGLTIAGLLLMPPTRHSFIHLNEARIIKKKVTK